MNSHVSSYKSQNTATFGAAIFASIAIQSSALMEAPPTKIDFGMVYESLLDAKKSTSSSRVRARIGQRPQVSATTMLEIASRAFTSELMRDSEPLGYEFSKILDDNFLDLLIT